jgi:hypothetical protein
VAILHCCASFFLNVKTIPNFEFVKPPFAGDEVLTSAHFDCHVFDFPGCDGASVLNLRLVPLVKGSLHLGVLGLAAASFLAFAADLDPPLQRLERHLVEETAVAGTFLVSEGDGLALEVSREHAILLAGGVLCFVMVRVQVIS